MRQDDHDAFLFLIMQMRVISFISVILYSKLDMWQPSFSVQELQFFASLTTPVTILPNFSIKEEIYLLTGKVGPFKAGLETHVPLWVALQLKNTDKCKIYEPFWFEESHLNALVQREKNNKNELTNLQNNQFFEISYIFLSRAAQNVQKIHNTRGQIESLDNIRKQKLRKLMQENQGSLKLKNLTTYEINRIRDPLSKLGKMVDRLKKSDLEKNRRD